MIIEYLGHSCFRLTTESGIRIVTDPYERVGYSLPRGVEAEIVTLSHEHFDHNAVSALQKAGQVVTKAGETRIGDVRIVGVESWHDDKKGMLRGKNVIYTVYADGLSVCHLGDIGEPCRAELVQKIGKADVLLVPVGGTYTVNAVGAKAYVDAIAPSLAIPMHYKPQDGSLDIASANDFLSLFDKVVFAKEKNRLVVTERELVTDKTEIVFMERV